MAGTSSIDEAVANSQGSDSLTPAADDPTPESTSQRDDPAANLTPESTSQRDDPAANLTPESTSQRDDPAANLTPESTSQRDDPAANLSPESTSRRDDPAANLTPESTSRRDDPAANLTPESTSQRDDPAANLTPESTPQRDDPAANLSPESTSRRDDPAANLTPESTSQRDDPAANLSPESTSRRDDPAANLTPESTLQPSDPAVERLKAAADLRKAASERLKAAADKFRTVAQQGKVAAAAKQLKATAKRLKIAADRFQTAAVEGDEIVDRLREAANDVRTARLGLTALTAAEADLEEELYFTEKTLQDTRDELLLLNATVANADAHSIPYYLGTVDLDEISNLVTIGRYPKLTKALELWYQRDKDLKVKIGQKEARRSDVRNQIYNIIGWYAVYLGVVLSAVSQLTQTAQQHTVSVCKKVWFPIVLTALGVLVTIVGVSVKFGDLSSLHSTIFEDRKISAELNRRASELGRQGLEFNFLTEIKDLKKVPIDNHNFIGRAFVIIALLVFALAFIWSYVVILCDKAI